MIKLTKKGIVLEINKDNVIVLSNSGEFLSIKRTKNIPIIGEEYSGSVYKKKNSLRPIALAACLILFVSMTVVYKMYYEVYNTIDIAINPSVRLYTNRKNNIIKTEATNEDGKVLLSKTKNLKGENSEKAIIDIIESAANLNYLNSNNPVVKIHAEKNASINYNNINSVIKSKTAKPNSVHNDVPEIKPSSDSPSKNTTTTEVNNNTEKTSSDKNTTNKKNPDNKPSKNNNTGGKDNNHNNGTNKEDINDKDSDDIDSRDDDTDKDSDDEDEDHDDNHHTGKNKEKDTD